MGLTMQPQQMIRPTEVNYRVYTDPEIFSAEMDRIFGATWVFVAHESEVREPGNFKTENMAGGRPLLIVRDKQKKVRVFFNVCRHRGARLVHDEYGKAPNFTCRYHAWTYGIDGGLDGVPLLKQMREFDPKDYALNEVPRVASYRGFVFASLSPAGQSLEEYLGDAKVYLDQFTDRAPGGAVEAVYPIKYCFDGNWKLQLDNYADNAHAYVLHKVALNVGKAVQPEKFGKKIGGPGYMERTFAHGHWMADYRGGRGQLWMNAYDDAFFASLTRSVGVERAKDLLDLDLHVIIYPNLMLHTRTSHYRVIRPIRVGYTEVWTYPCRLTGASDAVNETNILHASTHSSAMGEIQVDDMQALAWVQEGLASKSMEWVALKLDGQSEAVDANGNPEFFENSEAGLRNHFVEWRRLMA